MLGTENLIRQRQTDSPARPHVPMHPPVNGRIRSRPAETVVALRGPRGSRNLHLRAGNRAVIVTILSLVLALAQTLQGAHQTYGVRRQGVLMGKVRENRVSPRESVESAGSADDLVLNREFRRLR